MKSCVVTVLEDFSMVNTYISFLVTFLGCKIDLPFLKA